MDTAIQRYKSSLDYRDALDRFLSDFEDSLLPEGPFAPFGVLLLNEQQIQAEWQSAKEVGGSCLTRVNKTVLMLSAALAAERDRAVREKRRPHGFSARSGSWCGSWIRAVKSC